MVRMLKLRTLDPFEFKWHLLGFLIYFLLFGVRKTLNRNLYGNKIDIGKDAKSNWLNKMAKNLFEERGRAHLGN